MAKREPAESEIEYYLKEVGKYPPLGPEEEKELAWKYFGVTACLLGYTRERGYDKD